MLWIYFEVVAGIAVLLGNVLAASKRGECSCDSNLVFLLVLPSSSELLSNGRRRSLHEIDGEEIADYSGGTKVYLRV